MTRFKYGILGILIFGIFVLWQTNVLETTRTNHLGGDDNLRAQESVGEANVDRIDAKKHKSDITGLPNVGELMKTFKAIDWNSNDTNERGSKDEIAYYGDRTIIQISPYITEEEIALYNEHHIIPFNPVVDTVCEELGPDDFNIARRSCQYIRARPEHSYQNLKTDELVVLSATDPVASLILAEKTKIPAEKLHLYLRASALSSKSGPVLKLINRDYHQLYLDYDAKTTGNAGGTIVRLALENIVERLDDPRANTAYWERHLENLSGENYAKNLLLSNELETKFLQEMITIQLEVGRTDILEGITDA